ncbi:hypothetical protein HMPREF0872_02275 [Veillonella montpellierensis DNF00314]|uniref:Thioesterase domain-containing protein n=1 Tax=Veillonella montpellierensis DNF00314 TaxID=1401067 RepID=A0A096BYV9_9FIRM|nr:PaaI family thioesterase [Veillonella montpellierensis]KGF47937.1 hypothetical protein HMPREF0872_02275 [Veillonella montpellierensis DNF00314]
MITNLVDYFEDIRKRNTFEWTNDAWIHQVLPGHCEMFFQTHIERHANLRGDLHGGVCISFADSFMGTSCFTLGKAVSTLEISGNYLKPVKSGSLLRGVANVEHNGKTTMVTTGRVYNEEGELVFMSKGTFFVLDVITLPDLPWQVIAEDNPDEV